MTQPVEQPSSPNNDLIVNLIRQSNPAGDELLYNTFARGLRYLAVRHCPAYAEDCVQDTIMTVICQIRAGQLQTPAALPGYLNVVLKRTAWNKKLQAERTESHPDVFSGVIATRADARQNPEERLQLQDRTRILREALSQLKPQERELLTRFYLQEQTPEQICQEMQMTETQFRLHKSRSKKKLETLTQKQLQRPIAKVHFAFAS